MNLQHFATKDLPIYGRVRILQFSLATMLHLWLLVMQLHKSLLYGAIFFIIIMFFYFLFDGTEIRGCSQKIWGYSLECLTRSNNRPAKEVNQKSRLLDEGGF